MNILLDTHAFLWFIDGSPRLSAQARECIEDEGNGKLLSIASLWEIGIKISLGKLTLKQPFEELVPSQMQINGFDLLPVRIEHVTQVISMPFHHRDPFDRMLVAQCMGDQLPIVSRDPAFDSYQIDRIW